MKKNMGTADKAIRILIALVIVVLYLLEVISGPTAIILGVFSLVFILTSIFGFCPLYTFLGINTCKKEDKK